MIFFQHFPSSCNIPFYKCVFHVWWIYKTSHFTTYDGLNLLLSFHLLCEFTMIDEEATLCIWKLWWAFRKPMILIWGWSHQIWNFGASLLWFVLVVLDEMCSHLFVLEIAFVIVVVGPFANDTLLLCLIFVCREFSFVLWIRCLGEKSFIKANDPILSLSIFFQKFLDCPF